MAIYETVFIARQDLSEAQVKEITASVEKTLTDNKAKVLKTENWGLRGLAYRIEKNRKGHYVLVEFDAETSLISELERQLRLNEDVLRYVTVRREEASTEQSAILRSNESDDRYNKRSDTGYRPRKPHSDREAA